MYKNLVKKTVVVAIVSLIVIGSFFPAVGSGLESKQRFTNKIATTDNNSTSEKDSISNQTTTIDNSITKKVSKSPQVSTVDNSTLERDSAAIDVHKTDNSNLDKGPISNQPPIVTNPDPANGSISISPTPPLSVMVDDANNDTLTAYWLSNSSDHWVLFDTNSSINISSGPVKIIQTNSNFSSYSTTYWWSVCVFDGTVWTNETFCFTTEVGPVTDPFAQGWLYRKEIVINHSLVVDDLVNFPVLINFSDGDVAAHAQVDGDDIVFMDGAGVVNKLYHEIEYYDSVDGGLVAWVNVTSLSSSVDTVLYMYYGNPLVVSQENVSGVWGSGFVMVQHLNETGDSVFDSTSFGNDGMSFGTVFNGDCRIGGGREYDDDDDYIAVDDFTHLESALTAEAWVYRGSSSYINIFSEGTNFNVSDWALYLRTGSSTGGIDFGINDHTERVRGGSTPEGVWFYLTATYDAGDVVLYVNGSVVGSGTIAGSIDNDHAVLGLGNDNDGGQPWSGLLDELRVSCVARSGGWVNTSFNSMSVPDLFFSVGSEESVPVAPIVSSTSPLNGTVDVGVSLSELSFNLTDFQGDAMNYTVETFPDVGNGNGTGVGSGRYSISVGNLSYSTVYTWFVNVTDPLGSGSWTNETYTFTTIKNVEPSLSDPLPSNQAIGIPFSPLLSISVNDTEGDDMNVFFRTNASGSWVTIGSNLSVNNDTFYCDNTSLINSYITTYWWSVNVSDGTDWTNETFHFTTEVGPVTNPFAQGWQYRKKITINHSKVADDLTNFPVLIKVVDADVAAHAQVDGDDIIFMDDDGIAMQLHHEIEYYNSTNGTLVAWVNVTCLFSDVDAVLYMYYGNPLVVSQENPGGVWGSGFVMVQHLNETGNSLFDSTSYDNDGVSTGTMFNEGCQIDGGREYNGDEYIAVSDFTHSHSALTAEAWVYRDSTSFINIFCKGTRYNNSDWILYLRTASSDQGIDFGINDHDANRVRGGSTPEGVWFYLTATYDAGDVVLYVNGSVVGSGTIASSINNSHGVLGLGNSNDGGEAWSGLLDELRVSSVARSGGWVNTSFNSMSVPDLFFSVGSEESVPVAPIVSSPSPLNGTGGVGVSLSELSFMLFDYHGDVMNYSVETSPDIGNGSGFGGNGVYSVSVSGLDYFTTYTWFVNVSDSFGSGSWTNETFTFTTEKSLLVSDPLPADGSTDNPINPTLQITINDLDGNSVDWSISTNATDDWEIIDYGTIADGNDTFTVIPSNMNMVDTTYWWCVNATDGKEWTNYTYHFTTYIDFEFSIKWNTSIDEITRASLVEDLNGDGIKDIVITQNGVIALNGSDGSILWHYIDSQVGDRPSIAIGDLNNDGVPEIVLAIYSPPGAIALHGNDGSVYWERIDFNGSNHQACPIIFDHDRDGYPNIIFATRHTEGGDAEIVSVSYDGEIQHRTFVNMLCQGGISLMDYDNDGHFEIYTGNRHTDLPDEPVSVESFWFENLTSLWKVFYPDPSYIFTASATIISLVDVTGDGIRDLVTEINDEVDGNTVGVAVLSAEDGSVIRSVTDIVSGHAWTYSSAVYDIDLDGNPEWIFSSDNFIVWDLVDWQMDLNISSAWTRWQPTVADVTGDGYMDIVVPFSTSLRIFNKNFDQIATISLPGSGDVIFPSVMDLDNDGFNEIVVSRGSGEVIVIETNGRAKYGGARSGLKGYSEYRQGVSEYVTVLGLKDEWPPRDSTDVITNPPLFVTVTNYQDELMDITFRTNASGIWEDIDSFSGVGDGTYSVSTNNMDIPNHRYWWSVNATDRKNTWTNMTYVFTIGTSVPDSPIIIKALPIDNLTDVSLSLSELNFHLIDCQGNYMDYFVETVPNIGYDDNYSITNGTYSISVENLDFGVEYIWYVNVTDGTHWTNKSFSFTTEFDVPPTIKLVFAGNLSDQGGPRYLPRTASRSPDGYYTNASHQKEDWMYIKAKVSDTGSGVDEVFVQWLRFNATGEIWTNNTYEMLPIGDDYYEFNTSGNITVSPDENYSFDILATDHGGNEAIYQWLKIGPNGPDDYVRRYVRFSGASTNISYTPFYLYHADYSNTTGYVYGDPHWLNADTLHHDQGPDGTIVDTGYLRAKLPTSTIEERHCDIYVGYWFDETVTAQPDTIDNIYSHIWWYNSNPSEDLDFAFGKSRSGLFRDNNWLNNYTINESSSRSNITVSSKVYNLEAFLLNITSSPSFGDNDIYEFFISLYRWYPFHNPSVISSRSAMSFVIFNVPDNTTLQAQDTDNDGLNDYEELYVTFTSPFVRDTDNDGAPDHSEYISGSDPNNCSDVGVLLKPKWTVYNLSRIHTSGVLLADVTGDGIDEVIHAGEEEVTVLNGTDGSVIWNRSDYRLWDHVAAQMADLNNDGILEIIAPLEKGIHVFHGNNGSTYWDIYGFSGDAIFSSPVVCDIDGYGYPRIYVAMQDIEAPLEGALYMLSHDGQILASTFAYRACRGGLSIADTDYDGEFELYVNDRASGVGEGCISYWARNLTKRWSQPSVGTVSSHIPMIADINEDGILDIVVCRQSSPYGFSVLSSADGSFISDVKNVEATGHYQPGLYDIDRDGNPELLMANKYDNPTHNVTVWDLVTLQQDASFREGRCDFGPMGADVTGDGNLEMLVVTLWGVHVYNNTYSLLYEITDLLENFSDSDKLQFAMANDIDGDGLTEVVIPSTTGTVFAFDTAAPTPNPRPRSEVEYYSEYRLGAAQYVDRPGPRHPTNRDIFPANNSDNIDFNPTLSAHVSDFQWDVFNITFRTNASGVWEDIATYDYIGRYPDQTPTGNYWGYYTANTTYMTKLDTTYYWSIYAEDSKGNSIENIYHFTTKQVNPDWTTIVKEPFNLFDSANVINPILTADNITDMGATSVYDPFIYNNENGLEEVSIFEGFDSLSLNTSLWDTYSSTVYGRNQIDYVQAHSPSYAWRMDVTENYHNNLNELYTVYNFSGASYINIEFWQFDALDEQTSAPDSWIGHYDADAVAFTNDGTTWYEIIDATLLNNGEDWEHFTYNISSHPNFDPDVSSSFAIKFQQYDNRIYGGSMSDGRFWDDIHISYKINRSVDDRWYMFFTSESSDGDTNIALASSIDALNWTYEQIILNESFNVSSPLVFRWGESYYMIPGCDQNSVKLYKSEPGEFPYIWTFQSDLLTGRDFTDSSVIRYNGFWYMFVGNSDNSICWLYYSSNLTDPSSWTEHPNSPISTDINNARPAGRSIVFDGNRIIRWGMDCDPLFGQKVRAFEVDILTTTSYAEHEIAESPILEESGSDWNADGMHHVDPWWTGERWIAAVDGNGIYDWCIGIYATYLGEDTSPPEIKNIVADPDPQEVGGYVKISCDVKDNVGVDTVKVNITYPNSSTHNMTMIGGSYHYNNSYMMPGTYHYFIWANDTSGNANISATYSFNITELPDTEAPNITSVVAVPDIQMVGGYVNISCIVTDLVGVDTVLVNITYPDLTYHNETMLGSYYYNDTYSLVGTYYYFIWANDTSGNVNTSSNYSFVIVDVIPWDVALNFTGSGGVNDSIVFGEAFDASDGKDSYDVPKPGTPPSPYIYACFDANLSEPYDILMRDYRHYPATSKIWDLYVYLQGPAPSNITISWIPSRLDSCEYSVVTLKDVDLDFDINMLLTSNYTYLASNTSVRHFQIICSVTPVEYHHKISLYEGWNLISVPVNQSIPKENITVNHLGANYSWQEAVDSDIVLQFIYQWDASIQNYGDFAIVLDPGVGYWMYSYENCDIWITSNTSNNDGYITDLFIGWNLIGIPYETPVDKENITVYYNEIEYVWQEAADSGIVLQFIYQWDASIQNYGDFAIVLDPGVGYWMYAYYDCKLLRSDT